MLLNDSGGQYLEGTTDTTRTFAVGPITDEERRDFTNALKGVIALSRQRFLAGSTGSDLDTICRGQIWKEGLNYRCGTGHGVGFFLNVHEAPPNFRDRTVALEEGMFITIEPGVYTEGSHGVPKTLWWWSRTSRLSTVSSTALIPSPWSQSTPVVWTWS